MVATEPGGSKHSVSTGADTKENTLRWGGGALQAGDFRVLEDGGERGDATDSETSLAETVQNKSGNMRRLVCPTGAGREKGEHLGAGSSAERPTPASAASSCP